MEQQPNTSHRQRKWPWFAFTALIIVFLTGAAVIAWQQLRSQTSSSLSTSVAQNSTNQVNSDNTTPSETGQINMPGSAGSDGGELPQGGEMLPTIDPDATAAPADAQTAAALESTPEGSSAPATRTPSPVPTLRQIGGGIIATSTRGPTRTPTATTAPGSGVKPPTITPTATWTKIPPTATPTPTLTPTATATNTPTNTPPFTATPVAKTPTPTLTPTVTLTPTLTPTVTTTVVVPTSAFTPMPDLAPFDLINYYRIQAGVPQIGDDPTMNQGALNHAIYMADKRRLLDTENPSDPLYTPEGATAAAYGNLWLGGGIQRWSPVTPVKQWMESPYHRLWILYPQATNMGYAFYEDNTSMVTTAVLQVFGAWDKTIPFDQPIKYPGDGQVNIPPTRFGVSLQFPVYTENPAFTAISWTDAAGNPVGYTRFDPTTDAYMRDYGNAIFLLPNASLTPLTSYIVRITGSYQNVPFDLTWTFTTDSQ